MTLRAALVTCRHSMESQYESANLADYDVVRSTQFVEDLSRGVRVSLISDCISYLNVVDLLAIAILGEEHCWVKET
jgi:hypothetical protein